MKICFILPQMLHKPIGGYKIVYEYANRLDEIGYDVSILFLNEKALTRFHFPEPLRRLAVGLFTQAEPKWFKLRKNVHKLSSIDKSVKNKIEGTDIAIATGADTVYKTKAFFEGKRIMYFIQDHETWLYPEEELCNRYKLGYENIVISGWLKRIVDKVSGRESLLLRNPIDIKKYRVIKEPYMRDVFSIGVLYHEAEHKGFKYALEALEIVRKKYPQIKLYMFGTSRPYFELPDWMEFKLNASQDETIEIYNSVSTFVCATINEGYGLTGLEAMACGAALVSTEYEGVKEYAIDGYNALLSPIKDSAKLASNIFRVIEDEKVRHSIVENGLSTVQSFSWERAVDMLDDLFKKGTY